MLPSRPNTSRMGAGLPSAPRSRSVGRTRDDEYSRDQSRSRGPPLSIRTVRPQRSAANLPSPTSHSESGRGRPSRHAAPPLPSNPRTRSVAPNDRTRVRARDYDEQSSYRSGSESISSMSSISSSGSAFLDRMRGRSGYASSRTSLEEDADSYPSKQRGRIGSRPVMKKGTGNDEPEDDLAEPHYSYATEQTGFGSSLWSRVADAAGTLTVNVSKAWAANITTFSGEETPPGHESRLTRAMKAYHLEKARDPSDLPEWLFGEQERRPGRPRRDAPPVNKERYEYEQVNAPAPSRTRGLKDIYAAAAASAPSGRSDTSEPSIGRRFAGQSQTGPSKASDRLRAMREAKRGANALARHDEDGDYASVPSVGRGDHGNGGERRPVRAGLPSGPGPRKA